MSFQFIRSGKDSMGRLYYWLEVRGSTGDFQKVFRADQLQVEARAWLASYGEDVRAHVLFSAARRAPRPTIELADTPGFVSYREKLHFVSPVTNYGPYSDQLKLLTELPPRESDWSTAGSVKDWDAGVRMFCRGNPLLIVVLATAMSAPILARMGDVHPFVVLVSGDPSQGKSISAQLAAATYGGGPDPILGRLMPAKVTEKQIGPLLLSNNGGALFLDDPRQQAANQVDAARVLALWIFNAVSGTTRLRTGGPPIEKRFWTLLVATSNDTPEEITRMGGQRTDAASADRVMHLPAKRRYGVFDTIPDGVEASDYALQLQAFSRTIHGAPMDEVYHYLVRELNSDESKLKIREMFLKDRSEMQDRLPLKASSSGQARRRSHFANSFAAACALSNFKLIPFSIDELTGAFDEMYKSSEESSPRARIRLRDTLKRYIGDNLSSFIKLARPLLELSDEQVRSHAGYIQHLSQDHYEVYLPTAAINRITAGYWFADAEWEELASEGVLAQEHDRDRVRYDVKRNIRVGSHDRVYVVRSSIFGEKRTGS